MGHINEADPVLETQHRLTINDVQTLEITQDGEQTLLRVISGSATLVTMRITADAAEVLLDEQCAIRTKGDLHLEADNLSLKARERLSLSSEGDADISVKGDLSSRARIQELRATLGNVNIKANDDVKVRAERICLNT